MRKAENKEHIEGRVYQHDLSIRQVQNKESKNYGKDFIAGTIEVAVDEDLLNVIPVHFTYVTEQTASGSQNRTYGVLKKIIEENKTVVTVGKDEAQKVKIDTALALNDFYGQDDQLISVKTNEGGFVTLVTLIDTPEAERNTFSVDMVITNVTRVEKDEEKNITEEYATIKGAIFNFKNEILPVEFVIKNKDGIKYFEDLGASNAEPVYTKVWGKINCETKTTTVTEESAFGEAAVRTYERKSKEWVVTGSLKVPYDFGDENILTPAELTKAMQDRSVFLAEVKKRSEEYKAQKAAGQIAAAPASTGVKPSTVAKSGTFDF